MPKKETLNRVLQRAKRNANHPLLAVPKNKKFPIPEDYAAIVLHDTGHEDENRIIILGHLDLLQLLCEKDVWIADGTFKVQIISRNVKNSSSFFFFVLKQK